MKITGLCASPRGKKSVTASLVEEGLLGAEKKGADTKYIDLCKQDIKFCKACGVCYKKGKCVRKDDYQEILDEIMESDGIILGSPNYINSVSAQMKVFLDRLADSIHCQKFTGKYGFSVSTAGGANSDSVAEYLNSTLIVLGANTTGKVNIDIGPDPNGIKEAKKQAYACGEELFEAIKEKKTWPEQERLHGEIGERMKVLVTQNKDEWKHEYSYWKKQDKI
ncbi:multimeric flavodoxin WrbA [Methanomicrobium sp. W14]|uniref:flavodoxin family protein n=1 Tax=Methanomicrobium sp. W14 TaxID=2817839 RepID=UPI001AE18971|nr:flavodoxin family protein [Methanomicrobium sp. W14]MBP2132179.1 multimeric flavodoxin WrbA [Methanomicrobium sp. W14]